MAFLDQQIISCMISLGTKDLHRSHFGQKPDRTKSRGKNRVLWFSSLKERKKRKTGDWAGGKADEEDEWADWSDWSWYYSGPTSGRRDDDWKSWQDWGSGDGHSSRGRWAWAWVA